MESIKNIVVVELDETFKKCTDKPHLYVTYTSKAPEDLLEFLQSGKGPVWIGGRVVRLRQKLIPDYKPTRSVTVVRRRAKELGTSLKNIGFAVNQDVAVYSVYVVNLDAEKPPKLVNIGKRKHAVYVGQTSVSPEARYLQHKKLDESKRNLSSKVVFHRGTGLNKTMMPNRNVYTEDAALKLEEDLSLKLHKRGYRVFGDGLTRALKIQQI